MANTISRIHHFISAANQAHVTNSHCLIAEGDGSQMSLIAVPSKLSKEAIDINKRTWRIFRESVQEVIGKTKFEWICHRYRRYFNFTKLEQLGSPLLPKHIELFSIGSAQLRSRDIKERFPQSLKTLTREVLSDQIQKVQPFPVMGDSPDPIHIFGAPSSISAMFFHDQVLMDKYKQLLFSNVESLSFQAYVERFNKVIANYELLKGQIVPAPGLDGKLDYYKVYRKIATGDGLVAYALKPATLDSSLKPLIVFRPSQFALAHEDAVETYLNDVTPNIGEMGWNAAIADFAQLMKDDHFRPNHEKIQIAGYSLGGAHAQRFLAVYHPLVSSAIFYSDPGVDSETAEHFAKTVNQMPRREEPLKIQIFRMNGDFFQYCGSKHVGWGVTHPDVAIQLVEADLENRNTSVIWLHAHRFFDNEVFPYQMQSYEASLEIANRLDNSKRGPAVLWYERMRLLCGFVTFYLIKIFSWTVNMFSWTFGIKILRSSRDAQA